MPLTDIPTYSSGSPSCHREVGLQVGLCEDKGQDRHPPLPQFGDGLRDRPGIQAAVLQQRDHRVLVGACIRLSVPVVRIGRGVADLIGGPMPQDTQHSFLHHRLLPALMTASPARIPRTRLAVSALGVHADDQLAEVASLQQAEKGCGRLLQAVDDILVVADTASGDPGTDLTQECRIVCFSTFMVEEAAQRQALRQNRTHGGGQPVGAVALAHAVILRDQATDQGRARPG